MEAEQITVESQTSAAMADTAKKILRAEKKLKSSRSKKLVHVPDNNCKIVIPQPISSAAQMVSDLAQKRAEDRAKIRSGEIARHVGRDIYDETIKAKPITAKLEEMEENLPQKFAQALSSQNKQEEEHISDNLSTPIQRFTAIGRQEIADAIAKNRLVEFAATLPLPEDRDTLLLPNVRAPNRDSWARFVFREANGITGTRPLGPEWSSFLETLVKIWGDKSGPSTRQSSRNKRKKYEDLDDLAESEEDNYLTPHASGKGMGNQIRTGGRIIPGADNVQTMMNRYALLLSSKMAGNNNLSDDSYNEAVDILDWCLENNYINLNVHRSGLRELG